MAKDCVGESDGLTFWLARSEDYDDVMAISEDIYWGNDYLPHRYHAWLTEPQRVVMLAKREGKLVALESGLVVDDGRTVVVEGLRVCPSERGKGVAGTVQRFTDQYIQRLYPSIQVKRLTRGDNSGPQKLAKFTLLDRRAVLSLRGESVTFDAFLSELKTKLSVKEGPAPELVVLDEGEQLRGVLLDPEITSRLQLPGGAVIQDWQPLRPIESNLEVLRRRGLTWLADRAASPTFLSFHTPPYPIPYNGGSLRLNIDLFGTGLAPARRALLSHLERVRGGLVGMVLVHVYMHRSLWEGLRDFCEVSTGVCRCRDYWEQLFLEREL
ncbi:N-acetyltransferase 16, like [Megalops cyprinoides]|uniref:N-acetyltransferase 16, like n=1 Tax=Megalops cyprinoides TaxID=118141 RepID=UPI001864BA29|nr:N-acetyltransferase 16, like [Megalops cyprinoides]